MEESLRIIKGQLYPLGVHRVDGGISIVSDIKGKRIAQDHPVYKEKQGEERI